MTGRPDNNLAGFTLVELIVTVFLGALLLTMAVPSFRNVVVSNRLTAQANDLVGALNVARSEAIKRNGSVTLCRTGTATGTSCAASAGAWEHWIVRAANGTIVRRGSVDTHGGSMNVTSSLTSNQVVFGSDGLARTGGALVNNHSITVCSSAGARDNIRQIVLGAGSRTSMSVSSGGC